jgi:hypothetical protein
MNRKERYTIDACEIVNLPKHTRINGNLTVVENGVSIPFDVKRVYYLYDIPAGESRGGHAHRCLQQFIIAVSGSFDVVIDDGLQRRTVTLNRPFMGLHIRPGIWRELENFSSGAVCLVLASEHYDEDDYIRDYREFVNYTKDMEL